MKKQTVQKIVQTLIIASITLGIVSIPTYFLYKDTERIVIDEAGQQAMNVAVSISCFLEEDIDDYADLVAVDDYSPGNYNEAYYAEMLGVFRKIKNEINADFVFTEKMISDTEIAYILDGEETNSEDFSSVGSLDGMGEVEFRAFSQDVNTYTGLISDPVWGDFITGFAPIHNGNTGKVIGLVGVDFSANHIKRIVDKLRNILLGFTIFLVILTTLVIDTLINMRNKSLNTDYLTKLSSKRSFHQQIADMVWKAETLDNPFCLMMLDLDNFKDLNDRFGHLVGDSALIVVANMLQNNIRNTDSCYRYGGDEFAILLPNTHIEQAESIGIRIQDSLKKAEVYFDGGKTEITISIGVTEWAKGMSEKEMIELADKGMYTSKREGRNRISVRQKKN